MVVLLVVLRFCAVLRSTVQASEEGNPCWVHIMPAQGTYKRLCGTSQAWAFAAIRSYAHSIRQAALLGFSAGRALYVTAWVCAADCLRLQPTDAINFSLEMHGAAVLESAAGEKATNVRD